MNIESLLYIAGVILLLAFTVWFGFYRGVFASWHEQWMAMPRRKRILLFGFALAFAALLSFVIR